MTFRARATPASPPPVSWWRQREDPPYAFTDLTEADGIHPAADRVTGCLAAAPALPGALAGPAAFAQDATFHRVAGLADASWSSFRSHNHPTRYIRHSGYALRVDPVGTATDRADATFSVGH